MIRIWLMTLIILFMSSQTWAQDMGNWSDKTVCRVIATAEDNSIYLAEAKRRKLDCSNFKPNPSGYGNKAESTVPTKPISTEPGIQIYAVALRPADKKRLLSKPLSKTDFDFSSYKLAQHTDTITCVFDLRRVIYETVVEGNIEKWDMASGEITFVNSKVQINKGRWHMGGLSKDQSYIQNEVNLKLTSTGHLVGKMAYFNLSVDKGEAPRAPLYIDLSPHQRSTPLDYKNLATAKAEIWIDVEDWAGGVLTLSYCR
jgi:hypothetical protein